MVEEKNNNHNLQGLTTIPDARFRRNCRKMLHHTRRPLSAGLSVNITNQPNLRAQQSITSHRACIHNGVSTPHVQSRQQKVYADTNNTTHKKNASKSHISTFDFSGKSPGGVPGNPDTDSVGYQTTKSARRSAGLD